MDNSQLTPKQKARVVQMYIRKFSMGKKCKLCGGNVANLAKVLTCAPCRAKNRTARSNKRFL